MRSTFAPPVILPESGGAMLLDETTLGYAPGLVFCQHLIQVVCAGATWALQAAGPAGVLYTLVSGLATGAIVSIGPWHSYAPGTTLPQGRFNALKVVITGGAGAARAHITSSKASPSIGAA